jgi:hypothetical protein
MPTRKGLRAVLEVTGYPDGQFAVTTSRIEGPPKNRIIKQVETLMFNDVNEAKDAVDAILDYLDATVEGIAAPGSDVDVVEIKAFLSRRMSQEGLAEVPAVEAAAWLDRAGLLADSKARRGKPLRDLLRAGVIQNAEQRPSQPWGRWYIVRG